MRDAAAWLARYRRFWTQRLDALAALFEQPPRDGSREAIDSGNQKEEL
jgi:hypothetical protein